MADLATDEHGGEPQAVSRRAFLSTGAAGISAAALVPGAPDATAQTGRQNRPTIWPCTICGSGATAGSACNSSTTPAR